MKPALLVLILGLLFSSTALPHDGNGGTKGGQGVVDPKGKQILLRDLYDRGVCKKKNLFAFAMENPAFPKMLASFRERNWYLAALYQAEAVRLPVCVIEAPLKYVNGDDPDTEVMSFYRQPIAGRVET